MDKGLASNLALPLHVRIANPSDEALLLEWANDPITRKNAFSPAPIGAATHSVWFHNRLALVETSRIFIVETNHNQPIGQVRFDRVGEHWSIDYSISPTFRGTGLGRQVLEAALREMGRVAPGAVVLGQVKVGNIASRRVFESLGFTAHDTESAIEYRNQLW